MRSHQLALAAAAAVTLGGTLIHAATGSGTAHAEPLRTVAEAPATVVPAADADTIDARAAAVAARNAARSVLGLESLEERAAGVRAESALEVLASHIAKQSHPDALRLAFKAYYEVKAARPNEVKKPYLYFVDYGLDSRTPRGYVFDMEKLELVEGPFTVAHGRGSAKPSEGIPTRFSNIKDSATSSLGIYLAQETYAFSGKAGGSRYTSIGLRLAGLSGRFNDAARRRGIVVHGAPYVTASRAGRSEGCPAMEQDRALRLIPKISNGGLVFLYSPNDRTWLNQDPWVNRS
jgi:hypothetical protein